MTENLRIRDFRPERLNAGYGAFYVPKLDVPGYVSIVYAITGGHVMFDPLGIFWTSFTEIERTDPRDHMSLRLKRILMIRKDHVSKIRDAVIKKGLLNNQRGFVISNVDQLWIDVKDVAEVTNVPFHLKKDFIEDMSMFVPDILRREMEQRQNLKTANLILRS